MADFVDSTVKDIDNRLKDLEAEVSKLKAARAALVGEQRSPGRPAAAPAPARRGRRGRGPARARRAPAAAATAPRRRSGGGTRANQALELVRSRPGITIPDIAKELGIEPNYLYRVMPKLVDDGQVSREGQGWHPAKAAA